MYEYVWGFRGLWGAINWWQRLDIVVLALMLAYVVAVVIRVSHLCDLDCRPATTCSVGQMFQLGPGKLVAELNIKAGSLNSIAFAAPYLGLAGTCTGIVTGLWRVGIAAESALAAVILARMVPVALVTTAAGLLVAIAAVVSHNYVRTRIDLLETNICGDIRHRRRQQGFFDGHTFAALLSRTPFPLVSVPVLALLTSVMAMVDSSYETPTGFWVAVTPSRCEYDGDDRLIVLRVTEEGKVLLNSEQEDWNGLAVRLSDIYRLRLHRTLYLIADDNVPFQRVAESIDLARNSVATGTPTPLDITVKLITPKAMAAPCLEPVPIHHRNRHCRR